MAVSLTITVTNTQAARVQTALGSLVNGVWTDATAAQIQDAIKAWAKSRVIDYETGVNATNDRNTKSAEVW